MPLTTDRAVVFDVDGTLALCDDTDDAFAEILIRFGASVPRPQLMRDIAAANSDWALIEAVLPPHVHATAYAEILAANGAAGRNSECHPDIPAMLETLGKEYRLFVLSARDEASIRIVLQRHQLGGHFEAIAGATSDAAAKPDPRSFHELLSRHEIEPSAAVYIGDKDVDAELAQRAGTGFIGVTWFGKRLTWRCARVAAPADLPLRVVQAYRASNAAV